MNLSKKWLALTSVLLRKKTSRVSSDKRRTDALFYFLFACAVVSSRAGCLLAVTAKWQLSYEAKSQQWCRGNASLGSSCDIQRRVERFCNTLPVLLAKHCTVSVYSVRWIVNSFVASSIALVGSLRCYD